MRRFMIAFGLLAALAACGAEPVAAPAEEVQKYRTPGTAPSSITLVTVISNRDNSGAHSGLFINASERAVFDPAGTFKHPWTPEVNDLHYGLTPRMEEIYIDYHARETYRVQTQTLTVSPETAERILVAAKNYGAVPKAYCANSITSILSGTPGFDWVPSTFFPRTVAAAFAARPGVVTRIYRDDSPDDRTDLQVEMITRAPQMSVELATR
ncbi:hypothetical protein [Anianabacter salinae]|uniref:hypothetical protein n=1 Tax=Anianabacter salinae TaxID=2851023 RepID=UPI00225DED47|nr:hypothetical protein [Anianabacter salinae]MBV0913255.1 hypothetical protein [Anianabacter salinae]